ncbi:class II aldolase/adducin family protein [Verrucomicrobiaceae bacterium N1E253]|uniref:Class II aldolase/adducin family protein n=1 Tax=Oceaniferula marina TaxID=2748318 RepID=A0A851GHM2_9BACT|nr:class II aldolase/adducin family protein [Oceaniferula marina]NWK56699.1 class II aldolase/adducin family protein [Oceaniferula marina]
MELSELEAGGQLGPMDQTSGAVMYADILADAIHRVYRAGMTTTSGGNFSLCEEDGGIWITPAGVDKGSLVPDDMVKVAADGSLEGKHRPSSEFPIHRQVYEKREDLGAVIHAHPPALVAYALARQEPDLAMMPTVSELCGRTCFADYRLPGSEMLGQVVADGFATGANVVVMGNHGVAVGGKDMQQAYNRLLAAEFCAQALLDARTLGGAKPGRGDVLPWYTPIQVVPVESGTFVPFEGLSESAAARSVRMAMDRASRQGLLPRSFGSVSARHGSDSFVINAAGVPRDCVGGADTALIQAGQIGKRVHPDESWKLHRAIYDSHPDIDSLIVTQAPAVMAHALAHERLDVTTNPESWVFVREVVALAGDAGVDAIVSALGPETPVVLLNNGAMIVSGGSMMQTFDRLEVCEFTAQSVLLARSLGGAVDMETQKIEALREAFCS